LQAAQANLNIANTLEIQAESALADAQKGFQRANQDLNDAKDALQKASQNKLLSDSDLQKANNAVQLAQQALNNAQAVLNTATKNTAVAYTQGQAALASLADAKLALQQANNDLGVANWALEQSLAVLYQAQAAKSAADRTSALILSQGSTAIDGSSVAFPNLGGFSDVTNGGQQSFIVQTNNSFNTCSGQNLPIFAATAKVVGASNGTCTLSSGQQVTLASCTSGLSNLALGADVVINGIVNTSSNVILATSISKH
jgi:hypothetical protein